MLLTPVLSQRGVGGGGRGCIGIVSWRKSYSALHFAVVEENCVKYMITAHVMILIVQFIITYTLFFCCIVCNLVCYILSAGESKETNLVLSRSVRLSCFSYCTNDDRKLIVSVQSSHLSSLFVPIWTFFGSKENRKSRGWCIKKTILLKRVFYILPYIDLATPIACQLGTLDIFNCFIILDCSCCFVSLP